MIQKRGGQFFELCPVPCSATYTLAFFFSFFITLRESVLEAVFDRIVSTMPLKMIAPPKICAGSRRSFKNR